VTGPLLASLVLIAGPASAGGVDFGASWDHGVRLATEDGSTKIKLGGRVQNDWVFHGGEDELISAVGDLEDGTEFRRLRFYMSGTVQRVAIFKLQLDFAGGEAAVKDAWVGLQKIPGIGTVRVGQQYEPFGLETQTSSKYITFLERSLTGAFAPDRRTGILATNEHDAVTWAVGIFRPTDEFGYDQGDGEYAGTARIVVRPLDEDQGHRLVHLGVAGSLRNPPDDAVKFDQRPENHLSPKYVSTGTLAADRVALLGFEGAVVQGPFSLQSEYMQARVSTLDNTDPTFQAFYVTGSFFLTGESRGYKSSEAVFDRVKPHSVFDGEGGKGAWELAARFSRADLNDEMVAGGQLDDITVGLNWYPNPNFRWMANYVHADLEDVGTSHALLTRVQADF